MGLFSWLIGIDALQTIAKAIDEESEEQYNKGYEDGYTDGLAEDEDAENEDD